LSGQCLARSVLPPCFLRCPLPLSLFFPWSTIGMCPRISPVGTHHFCRPVCPPTPTDPCGLPCDRLGVLSTCSDPFDSGPALRCRTAWLASPLRLYLHSRVQLPPTTATPVFFLPPPGFFKVCDATFRFFFGLFVIFFSLFCRPCTVRTFVRVWPRCRWPSYSFRSLIGFWGRESTLHRAQYLAQPGCVFYFFISVLLPPTDMVFSLMGSLRFRRTDLCSV